MFKQNPNNLNFFFRVKVDAPLSSANVKFLLNQRKEAKFVIAYFYEPRSWYIDIANQSESAKEIVSSKIGENIEMLVCFICMGTQDRTSTDINNHYQISMNQHKN